MKLLLCQHGDSLPKETDPDRPLSPRGVDDVSGIAALLGKWGVRAARVMQSGKTRARQTAEILAKAIAPGVTVEAASGLDPMDEVQPMAEKADSFTENTLLVGHLPFMEKLVSLLVAGDEEARPAAFIPGTVACLEKSETGWKLAWMIRPDLVKSAVGG